MTRLRGISPPAASTDMTTATTYDVLSAAIADYFRGERQEMLAILAGAGAMTLAAVGLYVAMRDGFARGFAGATLLAAVLLTGTAVLLLHRDPRLRADVEAGLRAAHAPAAHAAVAAEAARVAEVIRKYPYYRYGALALAAAALAAAALTRRAWVHGAAAGVLLLVAAQLAIDHYSERRASRYAAQLNAGRQASP